MYEYNNFILQQKFIMKTLKVKKKVWLQNIITKKENKYTIVLCYIAILLAHTNVHTQTTIQNFFTYKNINK